MQIEKIEKYDIWNDKKKGIDEKRRNLFFKEGEIWWCSLGVNVGEEVYGKGIDFRRPVIILKKLSKNTCIVAPSTSKPRDGSWYHHICVMGMDMWIMMHQIRFISCNRLNVREAVLPLNEFIVLKKSVATLLGLSKWSPDECPDQWVFPNVITVYQNEELESIGYCYEEYAGEGVFSSKFINS